MSCSRSLKVSQKEAALRKSYITDTEMFDADNVDPFAHDNDRDGIDACDQHHGELDDPGISPAEDREILEDEHKLEDNADTRETRSFSLLAPV